MNRNYLPLPISGPHTDQTIYLEDSFHPLLPPPNRTSFLGALHPHPFQAWHSEMKTLKQHIHLHVPENSHLPFDHHHWPLLAHKDPSSPQDFLRALGGHQLRAGFLDSTGLCLLLHG
uniref:Uncharacterized protein n=1 Tax=Opuntia streptacantha TaxID=393608 RepID=A0A7C9AQ77_OPUST